jgi:hypothetical protein
MRFEKAAVEAALNRCHTLAAQIESELRKRPKHFVDKLSLFYVSLEYAADIILGQKRRKSEKTVGSTTHRRPQQRYATAEGSVRRRYALLLTLRCRLIPATDAEVIPQPERA